MDLTSGLNVSEEYEIIVASVVKNIHSTNLETGSLYKILLDRYYSKFPETALFLKFEIFRWEHLDDGTVQDNIDFWLIDGKVKRAYNKYGLHEKIS